MQQFKRSRVERKTDDQITRKTVVMGILTIAAFGFIIVFGIPFLIRFSIFLGDTKNRGNNNDQVENVLPPLPPRISVPFEATKSASVNIDGLAEPKVKVELLKDDVLLGSADVGDSGDFSFESIELTPGKNVFIARAVSDQGGVSELSKPLDITFDDQIPDLAMLNPSEDKITVDYSDFDVVGQSKEIGISATINGRVAMMENDGKFKLKLQLVAGKNDIEIVVRDLAGNEAKKMITITYDM